MKAFAITCTTCQKRLRVRDATAIGQIMFCPHCGSMVLVQPEEPESAAGADSTPVSAESAIPPSSATPEAPPATSSPIACPPAALEAPPVASPPVVPKDLPPEPPVVGTCSAESQTARVEADREEPLLPDQSWQSLAVQQRQHWLLLTFAALVGASLAVGLLGLLAVRMSRREAPLPPPATASHRTTEPVDPSPAPPPIDSDVDARQEVQAIHEDEGDWEDREDCVDSAVADEEFLVDPPERAPGDDRMPAEAQGAEVARAAEQANGGPSAEEQLDQEPPAEREIESPRKSPLPAESERGDTAEPAAAEGRNLAETLDVFGDLMEDAPFAPAHETPAAEELEPPARPARVRGAISVPQPEVRTIDVAARLNDPISGIEMTDVPLLTFVRFMSRMSTIPISLDSDALALVRRDVHSPVRVQLVDGRVQQVLEDALRPLGLLPIRVGDQLLVTRPPPAAGPLRHHRHCVEDLVGDDLEQLEQLADRILRFISPESWESAGGAGRLETNLPALEIHQKDTVLFRVLLFCERLRVARRLPRTTQLDPELCRLEPQVNRAQQKLQQPLHLVQPVPERMLNLWEQITAQTGLQILVDWLALAEIGWTPAAEMTFQADGQPLGEILAEMLQPLGLTYRGLDAATIQITTPEAVYRQWDVEFYRWDRQPAAAEDRGDRLSALREALQAQGLAPGEFAVSVDPVSQSLIAALPQPYHRWLQTWLADDSNAAP